MPARIVQKRTAVQILHAAYMPHHSALLRSLANRSGSRGRVFRGTNASGAAVAVKVSGEVEPPVARTPGHTG